MKKLDASTIKQLKYWTIGAIIFLVVGLGAQKCNENEAKKLIYHEMDSFTGSYLCTINDPILVAYGSKTDSNTTFENYHLMWKYIFNQDVNAMKELLVSGKVVLLRNGTKYIETGDTYYNYHGIKIQGSTKQLWLPNLLAYDAEDSKYRVLMKLMINQLSKY
jgi:hypothetical protein